MCQAGSGNALKLQEQQQHGQHASAPPKHVAGQPFEKRSLVLSPAEIYAEIVHHGECELPAGICKLANSHILFSSVDSSQASWTHATFMRNRLSAFD
jgi:hypothetical protein